MNFYRAQQDAKRKTMQLAFLFGAAVVTLVLLTNILVAVFFVGMTDIPNTANRPWLATLEAVPIQTWLVVTGSVLGAIGVACLYKFFMVRQGGRAIAESIGGQRILQETQDYKQKRLLNVVEEMALAAGIPVPPVYLVPEPGINAFAAGFGTDDAVVGITQGAVDLLNREELQGVIAHEFSHIMNGDTRINLRLIVLLHGILFIGMVGYLMLRGAGRSRSSSRENNMGLPLLVLGAGLMAIGYGGTFFGNLIKSGVSRQREYLADSSAVQYTRNPEGVAGALKKIGGLTAGSTLAHRRAKEASHMFFGEVTLRRFGGWLSTHPPLPVRIKAIDPRWDGKFPEMSDLLAQMDPNTVASMAPGNDLASGFSGGSGATSYDNTETAGQAADPLDIRPSPEADEFDVVEQKVEAVNEIVGNPDEQSHETALEVVRTTDPMVREAAHNPWAAKGLCYALLLSTTDSVREAQLKRLNEQEQHGLPERARTLSQHLADEDDLHRLTLLHTAMPALKEMSRAQYRQFMQIVVALIKGDRQIELFEWVLHRLLVKELHPHFERPKPIRWRHSDVAQVTADALCLLSALAVQGSDAPNKRQHAFEEGLAALGLTGRLDEQDDNNFQRLTGALANLRQLAPLAKPKLIKACAATVLADEHVTVNEGALLQGVAAALDCPLPPGIYEQV